MIKHTPLIHNRKLIRILLISSILLNIGMGTFIGIRYSYFHNNRKGKMVSPTIVIAGDSRAERGSWIQGLGRPDIFNYGISGITISSYLGKMDSIYILKPSTCILQIGVNDFRQKENVDRAFMNYERIIHNLIIHQIKPIITSTIAIRKDFWQDEVSETDLNKSIDSLNQRLELLCKAQHLEYVDVNSLLTTSKRLELQYTIDGIHLNEKGYSIFYVALNKVLGNYLKPEITSE